MIYDEELYAILKDLCKQEAKAKIEEPDTVLENEIAGRILAQKGIIIGHKGQSLKRVGTEARLDIEAFFGKKVFIEMYVKVNKNWRSNANMLKRFGYNQ